MEEDNRRQHPRIPLGVRFTTSTVDGSVRLDLTSKNISLGGVFLETTSEQNFDIGVPVLLQINGDADEGLRILGEVVYILGKDVASESDLTPGLGIRFVHPTAEQRARLESLLSGA